MSDNVSRICSKILKQMMLPEKKPLMAAENVAENVACWISCFVGGCSGLHFAHRAKDVVVPYYQCQRLGTLEELNSLWYIVFVCLKSCPFAVRFYYSASLSPCGSRANFQKPLRIGWWSVRLAHFQLCRCILWVIAAARLPNCICSCLLLSRADHLVGFLRVSRWCRTTNENLKTLNEHSEYTVHMHMC